MKILLIRRGAIGDVLMTTPLIRQIKQSGSNIVLDYCVGNYSSVALKNNPYIDNLIILEDSIFSIRRVIKFIQFILSIHKKYDHIFILGKNWHMNLLLKLSGANLIGFAREGISKFILNRYVVYDDLNRYQVLYYLDLLDNSNIVKANYDDIGMDLAITSLDRQAVNKKLTELSLMDNEFVVVTNSGGNNQYETGGIRMLPKTLIMELLNQLTKYNKVILLGGKVDYDNYQTYIESTNFKSNLINLAGSLSITQSAYLLTKCKHFYVTDCGAMHLGVIAKMNDKMTCFFGPTNPRHILPCNMQCRIIWHDSAIYDYDYQLYGKTNQPSRKFFTNIKLGDIL